MENQNKNTNKETANSLNKYMDCTNKASNIILDSANHINNWYEQQIANITENDIPSTRLETPVDNTVDDIIIDEGQKSKLETKVDEYDELQTNLESTNKVSKATNKIKTQLTETDINETASTDDTEIQYNPEVKFQTKKIPSRISTAIKGVKVINNTTNKIIKLGKSINTGLNEDGLKSFENTSSRIMTKPIKKVANKVTKKATNKVNKLSKKVVKKNSKKVMQQTTNAMTKMVKFISKLVMDTSKLIISMLPQIAPVLIIILIIASFCSFFGISMSENTKAQYEEYMINTQNEYDAITVTFYNQGKIVDGAIEGKGMINWKAPLSIIQMLNGNLLFDNAEKELLNSFKTAGLYETISDLSYTYEKEIQETDENGNVTIKKETITETKKLVTNPSLDDYLIWCNNNFEVINNYKKNKGLSYDASQISFTNSEVEQIKLLYDSNYFFELFSSNFKKIYAYAYVNIGNEDLQAIYNEFLKNAGTRYLMDHSNLSYNSCMDYYDCSSWVIHCLAHTGIKTIPNTTAKGIYENYCYPVNENDRQAGDLIFLKDTYNTGEPGSISHIGIYMGELTINGETAEWVIDTGGNPSGVRIRKYSNGWWNGPNFYGFARLK